MRCPFCAHEDTRVVDSRVTEDGLQIRRRRECPHCGARFSTYETAEIKLPAIVKRDGRREPFNEQKLRNGLMRACEKRAVSLEQIDHIIDVVLKKLRTSGERELPAQQLGIWAMEELRLIDQVAYVRFASVYRRFEDVHDFRAEIEKLEREIPVLEGKQMSLLGEEPGGKPRRRRNA